jgi:hypothetical protein
MNCSTFKKKLFDYMEDNVVYDMKEAMDSHLNTCESCRKLYEEEKSLDDTFIDAFKIDNINFTSSRSSIIKSIDKNKYSSPRHKFTNHLRKYSIRYAASAAVLAFTLLSMPYISKIGDGQFNVAKGNGSFGILKIDTDEGNNPGFVGTAEITEDDINSNIVEPNIFTHKEVYIPKFVKRDRIQPIEEKLILPWVTSPDGTMEATVDGRDLEIIGNIIIKGVQDNTLSEMYLIDNDRQYSPTFVQWFDNQYLLTVVGFGMGTVSKGGDLYLVNVDTGKSTMIYETIGFNEEIIRVEKGEGTLQLKVRVFTDHMDNYRDEDRVIPFKDVTGGRDAQEVKLIYDFADDINNERNSDAQDRMTASFNSIYEGKIGEFKSIKAIEIMKLIDMTDQYLADAVTKQNGDYKIYYAKVSYDMDSSANNPVKTGLYFQQIIVVKETGGSPWRISDIVTVPQS